MICRQRIPSNAYTIRLYIKWIKRVIKTVWKDQLQILLTIDKVIFL